jgi:hypothetical protein
VGSNPIARSKYSSNFRMLLEADNQPSPPLRFGEAGGKQRDNFQRPVR